MKRIRVKAVLCSLVFALLLCVRQPVYAWDLSDIIGNLLGVGSDAGADSAAPNSGMTKAGSVIKEKHWREPETQRISFSNAPLYNGKTDGSALLITSGDNSVIKETFLTNGGKVMMLFSGSDSNADLFRIEDQGVDKVKQYTYFDIPRSLQVNGRQIEGVSALRHDGPYKDDQGYIKYEDTYYGQSGNELVTAVSNLDGSAHKNGEGMKFVSGKTVCSELIPAGPEVKAGIFGYIDQSTGKMMNPKGEVFSGAGDSKAFTKGMLIDYQEEVVKNTRSVTLTDGSNYPVVSFSYGGGVITDQGYYIPSGMIKQANGADGATYNWAPLFGGLDDRLVINRLFETM